MRELCRENFHCIPPARGCLRTQIVPSLWLDYEAIGCLLRRCERASKFMNELASERVNECVCVCASEWADKEASLQ